MDHCTREEGYGQKRERERQGQGGSMRREEIQGESWAEWQSAIKRETSVSLVNLPEKISFGAPGPYLDDSTCHILVLIQVSIFLRKSSSDA